MIADERDVTAAVLAELQHAANPRFVEIMTAAVQHLHGFVRDARLTEAEFGTACRWIARLGQLTTPSHNEVVLAAGSLGVSALVCLLNNAGGDGQGGGTTANLMGPFWRDGAPPTANGGSIVRSPTPGAPVVVDAWVRDSSGRPLVGARVDVWHASADGWYENQDPDQAEMNLRGRFTTDGDGHIAFSSVKPAGYPVPAGGVAGALLRAQGRHNLRPAHIHFMIHAPGHKTQFSQLYLGDDPNLETDAQFGVTRALTAQPVPDGDGGFTLRHTFVVEPGDAQLPLPPISAKTAAPRPVLEVLQAAPRGGR